MSYEEGDTQDKTQAIYAIRHSISHVLAQAVQKHFPDARLGFGPPTETGFYYDFDFGEKAVEEGDLKKIEKEMRRIISQNQAFTCRQTSKEEALNLSADQPYKCIQINQLAARGVDSFSYYQNGPFADLCEGPHVSHTGALSEAGFCLDRIAGAYWLGSEKNKMLTRIYGLCFETKELLEAYLQRRKMALERDHKKLGKELEIFTVNDLVGKGLILWLPNGTVIREEIEKLAKEIEFKYGYQRVATPHITKEELFLKSQHLPAYEESMFPPMTVSEDGQVKEKFYLKPMNCPFHHLIFKNRMRSYRELPLRLAEYGTCYRFEQSGELSGLLRVRCMTMNDAHIYISESQLESEIKNILSMYQEFYRIFGLSEYHYRLSVRGQKNPEKFKGDDSLWSKAESILQNVMDQLQLTYVRGEGEAAFYGPKIDIQFKNLLGREETVSTIQVDFLSGINFELNFINATGTEERPVIIHRAPLSTHERFISFLLEYYNGAFAPWLAPVQAILIPVSAAFYDDVATLQQSWKQEHGFRIETDISDNSLNKKIRTALKQKIPLLLIIGQNEVTEGTVTIRGYGKESQWTLTRQEFVLKMKEYITHRTPMDQL